MHTRTARVFPHESTEDLDDCWIVRWRISTEPLQRIDTAHSNVDAVVTDLLDGFSVAVGELTFPVQAKGPGTQDQSNSYEHPGARLKKRDPHAVARIQQILAAQVTCLCQADGQGPNDQN